MKGEYLDSGKTYPVLGCDAGDFKDPGAVDGNA